MDDPLRSGCCDGIGMNREGADQLARGDEPLPSSGSWPPQAPRTTGSYAGLPGLRRGGKTPPIPAVTHDAREQDYPINDTHHSEGAPTRKVVAG